ncbi:MAG TPA: adenylate/guanylate cyclase domain-containing protein [Thermoleophilaceae bacterium]|nr:adenylate/guanylate cyclase domain-containing protein [Thermoleophilaceae bacterium]
MTGPLDTRFAHNGDVSIAYAVVGNGPVDLVVVPGFVSNFEVAWQMPGFQRVFERFAGFARLILFDKREQGSSDRLGRPPTLEQSMEDLRAVLDAAGSEQAALMGISEGGPMAILLAATFPERCSHLILYGSYARLTKAADYPEGVPEQALDVLTQRLRDEWGGPAGLSLFAPSLVGDAEAERSWGHFLRSGTSPAGARALMDLYRQVDVREALPLIDRPTLVLHRSRDFALPVRVSRYLAEHIPRARLVELPGVDHVLMAGEVDELVDEIEEFVTGTRSERRPERVLSTVLFTDIVGSTERAAELGDRRWRELLDRHDAITRAEVRTHRGRAVKSTGDGFLATFDGPARAIDCARAVAAGVGDLGVEVRAGVHTGECELRGDDIGGMAVHIGARVAAKAEGGEVLVSGTVKDLVVGSGLEFAERGMAALKGVPGEWRLYSVA